MYHVFGYRKKVVFENLRKSFPLKTDKEIQAISKSFYLHFSELIFEIIKVLTISKKELKTRIKYKNPEVLLDLYAKGKSCIIVTAHYGNWEWPSVLGDCTNYKSLAVYKPLSNKPLDRLLIQMRSRFGWELVPMNQAIRAIFKYRNENKALFHYNILFEYCNDA